MYTNLQDRLYEKLAEEAKNEEKIKDVTHHLERIFNILGVNSFDLSTQDTPKRIAKMWVNETCKNLNDNNIEELNEKMTVFDVPYSSTQEPITMEVPFSSWCEHHFMPFFGKMKVTYKPYNKIIGLSKIPRIVNYFSERPQVQERLGKEVAEYLLNVTEAEWVEVEIYDTIHTCVLCRGVKSDSNTTTKYIVRKGV